MQTIKVGIAKHHGMIISKLNLAFSKPSSYISNNV